VEILYRLLVEDRKTDESAPGDPPEPTCVSPKLEG
jgi:hypothetical protein